MLKKKKTKVYALGENISMSADKETLMILELMPYRACYPILKFVYSAAANASYNMGSSETNLVISKAEVNEGNTVKKLKPRARGHSFSIKRSTCHITIVMKDISLDDEYGEMSSLKKMSWKKKSTV
ncbi:hypothetical protein R3W88_023092 [Solanum pinnatisectum]|uniref:50S ribosomal protein L22, chloroplastic n=1 Tax=Solanum pinnatisectum TaxID=50273 RepID=A0AAV9LWH2_9SOLN|nr:hypothetical protein R3W88_023092 [Solanum pinnatisectum]